MKRYINADLLQGLDSESKSFRSRYAMAKFLEKEFLNAPHSEIQTNTLIFSFCDKTDEVLVEDDLCMHESGRLPLKILLQWLRR